MGALVSKSRTQEESCLSKLIWLQDPVWKGGGPVLGLPADRQCVFSAGTPAPLACC